MTAHQGLELADQLGVSSRGQVRVESLLQCTEPRLLQASDLRLGEGRVGQILKRSSPEQGKRLTEGFPRSPGPAGGERRPGAGDEGLEPLQVELTRFHPQPVPGWLRREPGPPSVFGQDASQPGDVGLEGGARGGWGRRPPYPVDQLVTGDHLVPAEQEDSKHRPLLPPSERDGAVIVSDLERTEHSKLHRAPCCRPGIEPSSLPARLEGSPGLLSLCNLLATVVRRRGRSVSAIVRRACLQTAEKGRGIR